jgi:hypothetical protein
MPTAPNEVHLAKTRAGFARPYDVTFDEMIKSGLHLMSPVGKDAVVAILSRNGKIEPTITSNWSRPPVT